MMNTRWSSTTKLLVLITLLLIAVWLLSIFSEAVPPLIVAVVLAYLLKSPADWIVRRTGWPRGLAIASIFLIILIVILLTPLLLTPSVTGIFGGITLDVDSLSAALENLQTEQVVIGTLVINVGEMTQQALQGLQNLITPFASGAFQVVASVATSLFWVLFVIVVVFWLVKDTYRLEGWLIERIPQNYREEVSHLLNDLGVIWGSFFRGELVLAIVIGTVVGLSMWILGVSNPALLAIIAGLMEFIPTIGPIIAAIPAILFAWFGGSSWLPMSNWLLALIVAIFYIIVFQTEQLYLLPRIVGGRVRLHPGVVFVGTVVAALQFGVLGVLLAAPIIASARLLGSYIYRKMLDIEPFASIPGTEDSVAWRGMIRGHAIAAVFFDLDGTIIDTDDHAIEKIATRLGRLQRIFPDGNARPFIRHWVMVAEGPVNWIITQFDRINLDDEAFRLNHWLRRVLGFRPAEDMQLIPGVADMLDVLKSEYKLALVTTRGRAAAEHFLASNDLDGYFEVIVTQDDVRRLKPHPEPVLLAAEQFGLEPERCVMVGDTPVDILSARAAGANAIGVLCGFGDQRDLEDADVVLDTTAELVNWL